MNLISEYPSKCIKYKYKIILSIYEDLQENDNTKRFVVKRKLLSMQIYLYIKGLRCCDFMFGGLDCLMSRDSNILMSGSLLPLSNIENEQRCSL